jgi:hypothetical protein
MELITTLDNRRGEAWGSFDFARCNPMLMTLTQPRSFFKEKEASSIVPASETRTVSVGQVVIQLFVSSRG